MIILYIMNKNLYKCWNPCGTGLAATKKEAVLAKVLKSFTLTLEAAEILEEFKCNRPYSNMSQIVDEAIKLWAKHENEKAAEDYFRQNPDEDF